MYYKYQGDALIIQPDTQGQRKFIIALMQRLGY